MRRRGRTSRVAGAATAVVAASLCLAACGTGTPAPSAPDPPLAAATVAGNGTAYVSLAMGELGVADNTFWELLADRGGRWAAITPPDVATNGGLVAAVRGPELAAGVVPSQLLGFSPLGGTSDGGRRWSPGVMPWSLARVPDALAIAGARALAITAGHPGRLVESDDALATWTTRSTATAIAAAAPRCGLRGLTAVALAAQGALVGGACSTGSTTVPVFERLASHWRPVVPAVTGITGLEVLRMATTSTGTLVLATGTSGGRRSLLVIRSPHGVGPWSVAVLGPLTGTVVATSIDVATGSGDALVRHDDGTLTDVHTTPTDLGRSISVPAGSALVVWTTPTTLEVLSVDGSHLVVRVRTAAGWRPVQDLFVPIPYGSST